mgnify:FL=1
MNLKSENTLFNVYYHVFSPLGGRTLSHEDVEKCTLLGSLTNHNFYE